MSLDNKIDEPIDWQALWAKMNWDDPEQQTRLIQERLRQRARQYAAPKQNQDIPLGEMAQLLSFELGQERYGIDVLYVHGVRKTGRITRVPGVPAFYRGVVNVRGEIVSVVDLRLFFGMEATGPEPDELLLVRANNLQVGLLAHHISEVARIPKSAIQPIDIHYAQGITSEHMIILDLNTIFSDGRLIVGGMDE